MGKGSYATKVTKSAPTMQLHLNQQPQDLLHKSTGVAEHRIAKSPTCIIVHDGLFAIRHNVSGSGFLSSVVMSVNCPYGLVFLLQSFFLIISSVEVIYKIFTLKE